MPGLILFSIASQFPTKRSEIVTYFWYVKHFIPINLHLTAIIANQNVENKMIPPNIYWYKTKLNGCHIYFLLSSCYTLLILR